jgi:hypothetical protein
MEDLVLNSPSDGTVFTKHALGQLGAQVDQGLGVVYGMANRFACEDCPLSSNIELLIG